MSKASKTTPSARTATATQPETVDPGWLLRALGAMFALALVCGYLTMGLLFYLSSWQLVLHPTHEANGGTGLPTQKLRCGDATASAHQPLACEWLHASTAAVPARFSVLYLRGADGQLDAADGTQIAMLHDAGLNVLAFDYRGYGSSDARPHPSEANMLQDAKGAYAYLAKRWGQHQPGGILLFGDGVGVSLAGQVAQSFPGTTGLIAYNADPEVEARVALDSRSRMFPLRLVFRDRFSLAALATLSVPKLLYTVGPLNDARVNIYRSAADPKLTVEVLTPNASQERAALRRFLDEVAPASTPIPEL